MVITREQELEAKESASIGGGERGCDVQLLPGRGMTGKPGGH